MARPIRSIDVYLPLDYNDGRPIPEAKYLNLQSELTERFGGVTTIQRQFHLQGVWRSESQVYRDRVVVFTVIDFRAEIDIASLRYLERLKERLKRKFEQLEILITVQQMLAI
jgi:hypothetical protein